MLELKNIRKTYTTKSGDVVALNDVSLFFPTSGMVFISGKSGCGKTTLLNVIGGLDQITDGDICLFGKSFKEFTQTDYDNYRNTFIGFVFQEYNLLSEFSVEKNIQIAMELQGKPTDDLQLQKLLKDMEIDDLKSRKPSELSGGQRQRVAIARALVKDPNIIMADEPTGALDSNTGIQVIDILKKLSEKKLVIVVSHDNELAEKYADRIIRLVDGVVVEDVTFSQTKMQKNIHEEDGEVLVRQGSDLSDEDKDLLAKAIKDCKKIGFIKEITYRESRATNQSELERTTKQVQLTQSKMKLTSALALGFKSLWVKPLRLIFTIILAAVAFAVFGLFDTLANFNTRNVMNNLVSNSSAVSVYGEYIADYQAEDEYQTKVSSAEIERLSKQLRTSIKGVYDFRENTSGHVLSSYQILQLNNAPNDRRNSYHTKQITGFVEFSDEEINGDRTFRDFDYEIKYGRYPKLVYELGTDEIISGLNEIAISTYVAESIFHYLENLPMGGKTLTKLSDLIGRTIDLDGTSFEIVGIIDCGEIPDKYDVLKEKELVVKYNKTLIEDFKTCINSSAHVCGFLADGRREYYANKEDAEISYYSSGTWTANVYGEYDKQYSRRVENSSYYVGDCGNENAIFFDGNRTASGSVELKDNEVLVAASNVEHLLSRYLEKDLEKKQQVLGLVSTLNNVSYTETFQKKQQALQEILNVLNLDQPKTEFPIEIVRTCSENNKNIKKQLNVVGVFVDYNLKSSNSYYYYKLMMNHNLMQELKIYNGQGEYSRMIMSLSGANISKLVDYMLAEDGLSLVWYGNTALDVVRENEQVVRQGADLFFYVALVLAVFSVFMLFNYISTSIVNKRQSIGVLRGLGSTGRDVFRMFLTESVIIAIANAILAVILATFGCIFVNWYIINIMNISVPFAFFGVRQMLIIFALSLGTAAISSALPIMRIAKENPVDLIRRV